ncbi:hypothetical protein NDU88_004696 [Pleurodeles waltl]|uniref:Uncharacterized protein n=1 Tax=Pleurodeles waltl TaxID=8319 RepID=A0AAV7UHR8_PLEWA|nr:hypothetical protein NDU88_004696 [Pleurodeles waltl]
MCIYGSNRRREERDHIYERFVNKRTKMETAETPIVWPQKMPEVSLRSRHESPQDGAKTKPKEKGGLGICADCARGDCMFGPEREAWKTPTFHFVKMEKCGH